MVDPVVNKGKVTVSTGYNSTATSIVLATGQGAELPDPVVDGAYNLPWWDSTNYNDPADDPNFEIVRVTGPAGTGDTKTIVRAQEGTAATNKNNADATYKMHLGVTAKTITDILSDAVLNVDKDVANGVVGIDGSGDINVNATKHLIIPLHNDAVTPSLAFGDGDTGLYESVDDNLHVAIGGSSKYNITATVINAALGDSWGLLREDTTATNPVLVPKYNDLDTGIGSSGADALSLIIGGIEGLRLTESGSAVSVSGAVVNTANGVSQLVAAPAAANSTGTAGQIAYDASFFYVCIATDTWERVGIASW